MPLLAFTGGVGAHLLGALEAALGCIGRVRGLHCSLLRHSGLPVTLLLQKRVLDLLEVKGTGYKEQRGTEIAEFLRQRANEGHHGQFFLKTRKSELFGVCRAHFLKGILDSIAQSSQGLICTLANRKELIQDEETRCSILLSVCFLQLLPHAD